MTISSKTLSIGLALFLLSSTVSAEKLFLLTENYPPFNMSIEDKNFSRESGIDGISTDIVREMLQRSKINYSMSLRSPWSRIYKMTQKKNNYGLFSTAYTEERQSLFKWVGPLVDNDFIIFKKAGSSIKIRSLEDLKQYRIGGYKGDAASKVLTSQGIPVIEAALDKQNAEKLEAGHIDLWASSRFSAPYISEAEGLPQAVPVYKYKSVDFYLALNLNVPDETVEKLQSSLDAMKQDGTWKEMVERYL